MTSVFDDRRCELGEGPLWHPGRKQLFWFDILGKRLLTRTDDGARDWQFSELVSAAGWVDDENLLIASETALFRFDLDSGARSEVCALEADQPNTRSNDGRADPQGGFWIGTMGKTAEPGAGAIYRWFRGELRRLFPGQRLCLVTLAGREQGLLVPPGNPRRLRDIAGLARPVRTLANSWLVASTVRLMRSEASPRSSSMSSLTS